MQETAKIEKVTLPAAVWSIIRAFLTGGSTGHITLHVKEGQVMQVEETKVTRA